MKRKISEILLNVIAPLGLGSIIYFISREKVYFTSLFSLRTNYLDLPYFIKYNLIDGLWFFALISSILIIWNWTLSNKSLLWVFIATFTAILFELFYGTFDYIDILAVFISLFVCILINKNKITIKI